LRRRTIISKIQYLKTTKNCMRNNWSWRWHLRTWTRWSWWSLRGAMWIFPITTNALPCMWPFLKTICRSSPIYFPARMWMWIQWTRSSRRLMMRLLESRISRLLMCWRALEALSSIRVWDICCVMQDIEAIW